MNPVRSRATPLPSRLHRQLRQAAEERRRAGRGRRRVALSPLAAPWVALNGRRLINFCGNDYLGLAGHPEVMRAGQAAFGSGASALVSGYHTPQRELEAAMADFLGCEATIFCPSGYQANLAVGQGLLRRSEVVLADRLNHASLNDGAKLAGARLRRFRHGDAAHAAARCGDDATWLATDGVFSMDGDLAPLPELLRLAADRDLALWLDDAHGFGVLGDDGRGTLSHLGLAPDRADVLVVTCGKALGTAGAFICGSAALIDHLVNTARPLIYSTAPPPALAAATRRALVLLQQESWRRRQLHERIVCFRERAAAAGLPLEPSQTEPSQTEPSQTEPSLTPIQPLLLGSNARALAVDRALEQAGFLVRAIRPPTVPEGSARLRITLSATHEIAHIDALVRHLRQCL